MLKLKKEELLSREQVIERMEFLRAEKALNEECRNIEQPEAPEIKSCEELYDNYLSNCQFYDSTWNQVEFVYDENREVKRDENGKALTKVVSYQDFIKVLPPLKNRICSLKNTDIGPFNFKVNMDKVNPEGFREFTIKHPNLMTQALLQTFQSVYKIFYARDAQENPKQANNQCWATGASTYYPPSPEGIYISPKALKESADRAMKDNMDTDFMESNAEYYMISIVCGDRKFKSDYETNKRKEAAQLLLDVFENRLKLAEKCQEVGKAAGDLIIENPKVKIAQAGLEPIDVA